MANRTPLMAGNWKMHHGPAAAAGLAAEIGIAASSNPGVDVALFVPFVSLAAAVGAAADRLQVGAQNAHENQNGAFTGEISCAMLAEVCPLVLLGHSERGVISTANPRPWSDARSRPRSRLAWTSCSA